MSRLVATDLPAFVLIKLPLRDGAAERAALLDAGLPHFIKGNTLCVDRDNVYAVAAEEMYDLTKRDKILDMLAVLGVPSILHISGDRKVTRCDREDNYLPVAGFSMGDWVERGKVAIDSSAYHIKGRNFTVSAIQTQERVNA